MVSSTLYQVIIQYFDCMLKFSKNANDDSKSKNFVKENRESIDESVEEGVKCKHKNLMQKHIYIMKH